MDLQGHCACGNIRYKLERSPMIVHACHCLDCQRITGSAFVINMWIEREFVKASGATPRSFTLKGGTGQNHDVFFCEKCGTYVWSYYHGAPGDALFVRAGTLETPSAVAPDVHIFTRSKVPWLELPKDARAYREFYKFDQVWSPGSLERLRQNRSAKK